MQSNFFAYLSRMKLIRRWSLMRNIRPENIQEHSQQVALIAHALCEIDNTYCGGASDSGKAVLLALYHDVGEVVIGDLPTPVKYYNPGIKQAYGEIENMAREKLLSMLPPELAAVYRPLFFDHAESREARMVKAADKLAAYIKCLEETTAGNGEFRLAQASISQELEKYRELPAVAWFMEHCLQGFSKTLDELD